MGLLVGSSPRGLQSLRKYIIIKPRVAENAATITASITLLHLACMILQTTKKTMSDFGNTRIIKLGTINDYE
jgi:hypothetical protein